MQLFAGLVIFLKAPIGVNCIPLEMGEVCLLYKRLALPFQSAEVNLCRFL